MQDRHRVSSATHYFILSPAAFRKIIVHKSVFLFDQKMDKMDSIPVMMHGLPKNKCKDIRIEECKVEYLGLDKFFNHWIKVQPKDPEDAGDVLESLDESLGEKIPHKRIYPNVLAGFVSDTGIICRIGRSGSFQICERNDIDESPTPQNTAILYRRHEATNSSNVHNEDKIKDLIHGNICDVDIVFAGCLETGEGPIVCIVCHTIYIRPEQHAPEDATEQFDTEYVDEHGEANKVVF